MSLDNATKTATAFETYAALLAACQARYIPTLRAGSTDELPIRRAKAVLESALTAAGCKVYA
jgi:hypothetical protein